MTIDGINFNKLPRKNDVKLNKEVKQQQSVAPEMSEAEKVALQKTRDKALTTYFLATMALAGGAAMTSCQNQEVNIPLEEITGNQQEMINLLKQISGSKFTGSKRIRYCQIVFYKHTPSFTFTSNV